MAEEKVVIVIDAESWSTEIEAMLKEACPVAEVRVQVESGKAELFGVWRGGVRVCAFVLRVDTLADGHQGVIVAAGGRDDRINLTDTILPYIEGMFRDCDSVRIHTRRRGLAKKLFERGYRFDEIVLTKELKK